MSLDQKQRIRFGERALAHGFEWEPGYMGFDPDRGGYCIRLPYIGEGVSPWHVFNHCIYEEALPDFNHRSTEWGSST